MVSSPWVKLRVLHETYLLWNNSDHLKLKTKLRLILGLAFECKFYTVGPTSHNNKLSVKLYFRVSSINFLRPGLEAFGRDTGTRDSSTALVSRHYNKFQEMWAQSLQKHFLFHDVPFLFSLLSLVYFIKLCLDSVLYLICFFWFVFSVSMLCFAGYASLAACLYILGFHTTYKRLRAEHCNAAEQILNFNRRNVGDQQNIIFWGSSLAWFYFSIGAKCICSVSVQWSIFFPKTSCVLHVMWNVLYIKVWLFINLIGIECFISCNRLPKSFLTWARTSLTHAHKLDG